MTDDNQHMQIWDEVQTTDPDHTKPVSFGRKFTAIDAHYQVKMATKQFGAIGHGWGYGTEFIETHLQDGRILINCDLTLWWNSKGKEWEGIPGPDIGNSFGPIRGCATLVTINNDGKLKIDNDAPKKASTDALTKCLSHLGFNADVFLGMFDDNKYVEKLRAQKKGDRAKRTAFIKEIEAALSNDGITVVCDNYKTWIDGLEDERSTELNKWVSKERLRFAEKADGSVSQD